MNLNHVIKLEKSLLTKFEKVNNENNNRTFLPSGLNGKALEISMDDIPSRKAVRESIPKHCFTRQTSRSLFYLYRTVVIQIFVVFLGLSIPLTKDMIPIWVIYAILSGTTSMGLWVLAHECGHGAFSDNRKLETFIGYCLHSFLLVPYFSWQRSHAIHHAFTNHITDGETHVPVVISGDGKSEKMGGESEMESSLFFGKIIYGLSLIHI